MGCVTTLPAETNSCSYASHNYIETYKTMAQTVESTETLETTETSHKTDYECVLSSEGLLEIPDRFKKWFPSNHGHTNISDLFVYHCELAHTAIALVYEIEYKSQTCALKRIDKDNEYGRMLFETEAQVLSKLKHNGIISLIDILFDEKYYYLVLQKADFDLHHVLMQKRYLSEAKTRNIIYSLLKTIRYMHRRNLVHRDLKPENIMFMSSDTNHPILIDFGDVEMAKDDQIYTEFVGTPSYMSPERLSEHKGWELKKSDIWAIGAIAYEMYCGRACFVGNTEEQILGRILCGDWLWSSDRVPSDGFKDFVEQCLAHDATDRPSAIEALEHQWLVEREQSDMEMNMKQSNM